METFVFFQSRFISLVFLYKCVPFHLLPFTPSDFFRDIFVISRKPWRVSKSQLTLSLSFIHLPDIREKEKVITPVDHISQILLATGL